MRFVPHLIDGAEVESVGGERFESIDPWRRAPWAEVALGGAEDAEHAVTAARRAFDAGPWPRMGFAERGRTLHRLADLIEAHATDLALLDSTDMGKPVSDAIGMDVPRSAHNLRFFADHARMSVGDTLPMDTGHHAYTRFEPAGVVVAIAPWNFPLMLETWKIAPALAWGNCVVLKPAEDSPASAHLLGRLGVEAGLPPGVLNVVQGFGPGSTGEVLTEDRRVDRITFTGESATGRAIAGAAAANLTPVSLELGGKGANLVFDDADIERAVRWSALAIFSNAGQVCLAGSRLLVQRRIYDQFLHAFTRAAEAFVAGDPKEPSTTIGPLSSEAHFNKVRGYVENAAAEGATVITGGTGEGWAMRPTILAGVPAGSRVRAEEIFGPVVVIDPFDSEQDGVAAANDSRYGLNAMVFTENLSRAHRVAAALRAGTVWTNCFFIRDLRAPFGGAGDSGVGREGGDFSREFFTEPKAVVMEIKPAADAPFGPINGS